jgi:hypothetical protein
MSTAIKTVCRFLVVVVGSHACKGAESRNACPEVVGVMVPQFIMNVPNSRLERVELRKCGPGRTEDLQIIAWERNSLHPTLVVDTTDFTVVQYVMSGRVFVIETTGGPRDRVFVILYEHGKPSLVLQRVTKARAEILSDGKTVRVSVLNSGTGKKETFSFSRE